MGRCSHPTNVSESRDVRYCRQYSGATSRLSHRPHDSRPLTHTFLPYPLHVRPGRKREIERLMWTFKAARSRLAPCALAAPAELIALHVVQATLSLFPRPGCCSTPPCPLFLSLSLLRFILTLLIIDVNLYTEVHCQRTHHRRRYQEVLPTSISLVEQGIQIVYDKCPSTGTSCHTTCSARWRGPQHLPQSHIPRRDPFLGNTAE